MRLTRNHAAAAMCGLLKGQLLFHRRARPAPKTPRVQKTFPFLVELPDGTMYRFQAPTASEARAMAKERLGIDRRDRLPVGTKVLRPEKLAHAA